MADPVMVEHAHRLLLFARLYQAIGTPAAFAQIAVDLPLEPTHKLWPHDVALGVQRFHEQLRRAVQAAEVATTGA